MTEAPFTAADVRSMTRTGRAWVFRLDSETAPALWRRVVATSVDADGCRLAATLLNADGHALGEPQVRHVTWQDFVDEVLPPADASVDELVLDTPIGELHARVYAWSREAGDGSTLTTRAWFAVELPGAPLRWEMEREGRVISRLTLEAHEEGDERAA